MRIEVVSLSGTPVASSQRAEFDHAGGTIGRAEGSTLVLNDPERTVSRVHAQVVCRADQYFIVDRGSNPLIHNGKPLGAGNEAALSSGDRLMIGSFELSVQDIKPTVPNQASALAIDATSLDQTISSNDPFAGLLDGLAVNPTSAAVKEVIKPAQKNPEYLSSIETPFFSGGKHALEDPFADLLGASPGPISTSSSVNVGIPDDFSDLGIAIPSASGSSSIDSLFGLSSTSGGADPFANSLLADPLIQPNTAGGLDPMQALQSPAQSTAEAISNHVPALRQAFIPAPTTAVSSSTSIPSKENFSTAVSAGPVSHVPQHADTQLLAAFLRGVNSNHQMPIVLTPGLMERIGGMLRSATEGTLQLLLTRQEFKREVRAEVTMIGSQHNNPLKFSPTVEVALAHLLGPGVRGFMPAEEAMADAFHDLRAHQFGVMVGLHAALEHILKRFTPEELEKRLTEKTAFDSLFAANRKAKLWDQFCILHASISQEAQDDFHKLFGQAFSKAYEEQMARFKSEEYKK